MEGCGKCLKWLMFFFNFLFFVCGAALLGIGIWVRVDAVSFMNLIGSNEIVFNSVYMIIAVGAALLVISFLGCCGALKENKCLLGTFFAIVLIIFIVEIVAGVLAFVYLPDATQIAFNSISQYNASDTTNPSVVVINEAWDAIQAVFGCCGINSSANWQALNPIYQNANTGPLVPDSCCLRDRFSLDGTIANATECRLRTPAAIYNVGCEQQFQNYFWVIGGVGLGVLAVELLAMIFACCLYRSIDKDY